MQKFHSIFSPNSYVHQPPLHEWWHLLDQPMSPLDEGCPEFTNRWEIKPAYPPMICVCQSLIHCPGLQHPLSSRSPHSVIRVETNKPAWKKNKKQKNTSLFLIILPRAWRKHFWKIKENQTNSSLEKMCLVFHSTHSNSIWTQRCWHDHSK